MVITSFIQSITSPTKFCHMNQIILWMWSCDQSSVTLAFAEEKLAQPQFFDQKNRSFGGEVLVQVQ